MIDGLSKDIPTANQLNQIRKDMGMTQSAMAIALGLSKKTVTIAAWEHGDTKPTPTQWAAIRYLYTSCMLLGLMGDEEWNYVRSLLPEGGEFQ